MKPRVPGTQLKVLYGDDQVWMDNRSGKTVVIDGYGGEPYLRFAPQGIFVNVNSPAGYLNQDRYGKSVPPKSATVTRPRTGRSSRAARSGPGTTTGSTT